MKNLFIGLVTMAITVVVQAQTNNIMIRAGKLFDSESGVFKKEMVILVKGQFIADVKAATDITDTDKQLFSTVIDLGACTVIPGLIDAHTHLLNKEVIYPGNGENSMDMIKVLTLQGDAYRALYGAARAKAYLEKGITSVQDLGNSGQFADMALKRAINEGLVPGPRMRCSGPGLSTEGGQAPGLIFKHRSLVQDEYRIIISQEDAIQAVRENINQGADVIKIYANNTPNNTMLTVEEMAAIVKEAHRYHVRVTAHATSNEAAYNAAIAGVDCIEHGYQLYDSTLALMARKNIYWVPTYGDSVIISQYVKLTHAGDENSLRKLPGMLKDFMDDKTALLQKAIQLKVTIVAGSDDYMDFKLPMGEPSIRNLLGYREAGMTVSEVLIAATLYAAKHLRLENKAGVIKKGAYADIVAFGADLDINISALLSAHFVMKEGLVYLPAK